MLASPSEVRFQNSRENQHVRLFATPGTLLSDEPEIIVSLKGETSVQTKGFIGGTCREASKFIEEALGKRTGEQRTGEFYQTESARQENQQRT